MAQGFNWVYNFAGTKPFVEVFFFKDTETLTKGDLLNLEAGEVDLGVTTDTTLIGLMLGPEDPADAKVREPGVTEGINSTTKAKIISGPDEVYEDVDDTSARNAGVTLDISGTTGAMALATSNNTEVVVVGRKEQAADPTRFHILDSLHPYRLG